MVELTTTEQFWGLLQALVAVVTAIQVLSFLLDMMGFDTQNWFRWLFGPPGEGPAYQGFLPETIIACISIVGGIALYTLISLMVLIGVFAAALFGYSFEAYPVFAVTAAISILFTIFLQRELRYSYAESGSLISANAIMRRD